jgi:hypothetical protein
VPIEKTNRTGIGKETIVKKVSKSLVEHSEKFSRMEAAASLAAVGVLAYMLTQPGPQPGLPTDDQMLEGLFVQEAMYGPLNLNVQMPSAVNSNLMYAPTPDFRGLEYTGDFREWKIRNARFHGRERRFGVNGGVWGDRYTGDPVTFVVRPITKIPFNEIW